MGRRRRRQKDDDYDDTLERAFVAKRLKPESDDSGSSVKDQSKDSKENNENGVNDGKNTDEKNNIERLREKKRLKKLRQKEKKLAAQKEQEKLDAQRAKERKETLRRKQEQKKQKEKVKKLSTDSRAFLNTSMGVRYADIEIGKGPVLVDRKRVICKYILRANDKKGKFLDSGDRFSFRFGKNEVIRGWEIGLEGMRQGGLRHIIVPPEAGYGNKDIGGGKGAMLYFEVTLLQC